MKKLACLLVLAASGCPDVKVDADETGGPVVEFDPARSLATGARFLPFPNDLVRDPTTGKLNLSAQACETPTGQATREDILNQLDGFGTYESALAVTFSAEVDMASLEGNVVVYQMTNQGTTIAPANAVALPVIVRKTTTLRQLPDACTSPETVNAVVIVPMLPLKQKSTYVAAILKGVKDTSGKEFTGSATWGLVNAKDDPVTLDAAGNVVSERTPLEPADPAQLAQLQALDQLWKAHATALGFLDAVPSARPRTDNLVAFQFTTQTVTDPLDPSVAGSPAAALAKTSFLVDPVSQTASFGQVGQLICGSQTQPELDETQCFLKLALGGCDPLGVGCGLENPGASPFYAKGAQACQVYNCAAIGDVLGGAITSTNYQTPETNTFDPTKPLQGPWSDPVNPASQGPLVLETLVVVPASTMPTGGWPVVIYGHGLTLSKETALTFAGWAAQFGFATVAVDFSGHGSRAVRTSKDVNLACTGRCVNRATGDYYAPNDPACAATGCTCEETKSGTTTVPAIAMCPNHDPTSASGYDKCGKSGFVTTSGNNEFASPTPRENGQCYDSPLSSNLAKTRDGFRQTVLDLERVVNAVKACGNGCGAFTADPTKIVYVGVSLGGILGSIASAESPDIKAAMLSVPGGGWVDLLENTDSVAFRCSFIDSLIDAQILSGTKWNLGANTDALCLAADKTAWQGQPGYPTFAATGRWVLDPADPANFASKLATKRFFIQEVTNDEIVPNIATDRLAALTGIAAKQMPGDNTFNPSSPAPSAAVATPTAMESKYIKYTSDTGAAYSHASLIRPANSTTGVIGTLRMQFDAAYWIFQNK